MSNAFIWKLSLAHEMHIKSISRAHEMKKIVCRAHEMISRAHEIISRVQEIINRAHEIINRAHEREFKNHSNSQKYFCVE